MTISFGGAIVIVKCHYCALADSVTLWAITNGTKGQTHLQLMSVAQADQIQFTEVFITVCQHQSLQHDTSNISN